MAEAYWPRLGAWLAIAFGAIFFIVPLIATFEFSLRKRRGEYSFDAYTWVFADQRFVQSFGYSTIVAITTIAVGVLLVVPTAYTIRVRYPRLRPVVEFITLMPLVIPAIIIVFGYLRLYNSSSWLPMTSSAWATDILLVFAYATLALPYMYRAVDTGMRTIDARVLTEAAQSLGAGWLTIMLRVILPNVRVALLSGASRSAAIAARNRPSPWFSPGATRVQNQPNRDPSASGCGAAAAARGASAATGAGGARRRACSSGSICTVMREPLVGGATPMRRKVKSCAAAGVHRQAAPTRATAISGRRCTARLGMELLGAPFLVVATE